MPKYTADDLPPDVKLVVVAKYVTAKTMTSDGWRVVGFHEGAPLPADVPYEDKQHLYRNNLVREEGWTPDEEPDTTAEEAVKYAESVLAGAKTALEAAQTRVDEAEQRLDDARAKKAEADDRAKARTSRAKAPAKPSGDDAGQPATTPPGASPTSPAGPPGAKGK